MALYDLKMYSHSPDTDPESGLTRKPSADSGRLMVAALLVAIAVITAVLAYVVNERPGQVAGATTTREEASREALTSLSEIMLLPADEQPSIATIVDVEKLKAETGDFYAAAQNGDLLILYSDKAIIYRYADQKIINVASIIAKGS